jgi:hypothetical protein
MTAIHKPKEQTDADEERRLAAIRLIQSWRDAEGDDLREQAETCAYLEKALNEHRTSDRRRI